MGVTAADRAKAAELFGPWWDFVATSEYASNLRDRIAAALAEARADADARWTAADADLIAGVLDSVVGDQLGARAIDFAARQIAQTLAAARLRGLATGNNEEGTA